MGKTKGSTNGRSPASGPKSARRQQASTKRRGELSELAFLHKAASLGFGVAKPYGDSERYDFILDSRIEVAPRERIAAERPEEEWRDKDFPHKLWRVQVKCTTQLLNGQYRLNAHRRIYGRAVPYHPSEVDFLVAHIVPEDVWFILPIRATEGRTSLFFSPKDFPRPGMFDPYREAWRLFRQSP